MDDESLFAQETEENETSCVTNLDKADRDKICAVLGSARDELEECFAHIPHFTCDLVEICCGPDSNLSGTINQHGGKAFRIGMHNDMDLTTI